MDPSLYALYAMQNSNIFLCQDILLEVLHHLAPGSRDHFLCKENENKIETHRSECRQALVACATVSRAMSQQALNVLWAELEDLGPILQFLPGYRLHSPRTSLQTMSATISAEAWSRLQSYATRVRSLALPPSIRVHSTFWSFLARQCAGAPLLPNLRVLDGYFLLDIHVAPLLLLLTPSLREVSISFDEIPSGGGHLPDIVGSFLQSLALTAPHMKVLNLLGNHSLDHGHLLYLERFSSVKTLCLGHEFHLDEDILQTLSEMATIRHLNVSVRLGRGDRRDALDFGDCFHGLHTLELRGRHKEVSEVFVAMSAPRLDTIGLDFTDSPSTSPPHSPFSAIAPHIPNTVTSFSCTFCVALDPHPKSLTDLLGPLPPLLPKLASFDLTSEKSPLSVTNDDLARLGDAWPLLANLNVRVSAARFNLETVRRPDVHGLAALAQRCPQLEALNLPELNIDKPSAPAAGTGPAPAEAKAVPFLSHRLKTLLVQSVSLAPTKAQHEAAVALDMLFPSLDLRTMRPGLSGGVPTGGAWGTIWRTLEIMRWGRQNRALAEGGCDAAVPEVPDMPAEPGGVRRRQLLPPHLHPHLHPHPHVGLPVLQQIQQMQPPPPPPPMFNANDWQAVVVDDDSDTE